MLHEIIRNDFWSNTHCNVGTMLQPFEILLQCCVTLKIVVAYVPCNGNDYKSEIFVILSSGRISVGYLLEQSR